MVAGSSPVFTGGGSADCPATSSSCAANHVLGTLNALSHAIRASSSSAPTLHRRAPQQRFGAGDTLGEAAELLLGKDTRAAELGVIKLVETRAIGRVLHAESELSQRGDGFTLAVDSIKSHRTPSGLSENQPQSTQRPQSGRRGSKINVV